MNILEWSRQDRYQSIPDDWHIVVIDIVASTSEIAAGKYKDINVVGAGCVVAVTNAIGESATHFVFGGDGATFAVAPQHQDQVVGVLTELSRRAHHAFGFQCRLGAVGIRELRMLGADVRMSKARLSAGFSTALFAGGGVALADRLIKQNPDRYAVTAGVDSSASVRGLECRWHDVPTSRGQMMTLMVRPRSNNPADLADVLLAISKLIPAARPVSVENLPFRWPPQHLWSECKMKIGNVVGRIAYFCGIWLLTGFMSRFVKRNGFDASTHSGRYCSSILDNTDFLKYDDTLRAVLDLTEPEAQALELLLARKQAQGILDYGVHLSQHALMTCFVSSLEHHMHFIDGGDGGYTRAAQQLNHNSRL